MQISKTKNKTQISKLFLSVFVFIITFILLILCSRTQALAQTFSLTPATASKSANLEFNVLLNIDTNGKKVTAADVKLTFDPLILQVVKITEGTFFTDNSSNIYSGTLYVGGSFATVGQTATGSGLLATITLKGKTSGISQLKFVCSAQTTDSNIFDDSATPKDIINCAGIKDGSYTFSGGTAVTATPSIASTSATPSLEPPVTGFSLPTYLAFGLGGALMLLGLLFIF